MTTDQEERFVVAFEKIAVALTGIHETRQKQFTKQWPERRETREAVYSRLPTEEDLIREQHGASSESLEQWLSVPEEEEAIGPRERELRQRKSAGSQTVAKDLPGGSGTETPEDQA